MRRFLVINSLFLLLLGCENEQTIIKSKGLIGEAVFLYFRTEKEGYSFNNRRISDWKNVTKEQMNDPNYFPESSDEAYIFKTIDGGKHWTKLNTIRGYSFYESSIVNGSSILIKAIDERDVLRNNLIRIDLRTNKIDYLSFVFERMGEIWSNGIETFVNSANNGMDKIYSISPEFKVIDSTANEVAFKGKVIDIRNNFYVLTWNNHIYNIVTKQENELPIIPARIVKQDENSILIAGRSFNGSDEISLVNYDPTTRASKVIKRLKNYSIVNDLQSNDKAIVGFIGNVKGAFVKYDLLYSLDRGRTWQIKKLEDPLLVRPNCLFNNVVFINSGGVRVYKIILS